LEEGQPTQGGYEEEADNENGSFEFEKEMGVETKVDKIAKGNTTIQREDNRFQGEF
jgi:hypothetical protein